MDTKDIIVQGTLAKYLMVFATDGPESDGGQDDGQPGPEIMDFRLELSWGYRQETKVIHKNEMLEANGGYLFELDTSEIVGKVKAKCVMIVHDSDITTGERTIADDQWLCFVAPTPCPKVITCPKCEGDHPVSYTRIDDSDFGEKYLRLVDVYDRPLMTVDDEYIYVPRQVAEQINELLNN